MSSLIQLNHISKRYEIDNNLIFTALKDINITLNKGEFASLVGPSGSGKSTLMHIIGLLDKQSEGDVIIDGRNINQMTDNSLSTLRNEFVGFVFQQFNLITKLTVLENVLLPTVYARKKITYDVKKRALDILERFGIADKTNSYPNKISGGQQQRVAIARSLIMEPKLILADEPTGNLDTKSGEEIMKLLKQLNKEEDITVLIVTHEEDIAAQTKRRIHIVDGELKT